MCLKAELIEPLVNNSKDREKAYRIGCMQGRKYYE